MSFSDFRRLADVISKFGLVPVDTADLFAGCADVTPSEFVRTSLRHGTPLATAIGTEKARSELIVAPLLLDLKVHVPEISLFSGVELSVDPEAGLTGVCDFMVSRTPEQHVMRAPIVALVEAKNENLREGLAQCLAEMVAAQIFNQRENNQIAVVYGAVTTGSVWKFSSLTEKTVTFDPEEYPISRPERLLGILIRMATGKTAQGSYPSS